MDGMDESREPSAFETVGTFQMTYKYLHRGSGLFEVVVSPRCVRSRASVLIHFDQNSELPVRVVDARSLESKEGSVPLLLLLSSRKSRADSASLEKSLVACESKCS